MLPTDSVTCLRGVGPARARQFEALGVRTVQDLLCHYPRAYEDRTALCSISELEAGRPACFRAMVTASPRTAHIRKGLDLTKVVVSDHTGRLNLTFFNQRFVAEQLEYGREFVFYGAVSGDYAGYGMTNPVFERPDAPPLQTRRLLPIYPLTAGLSNTAVSRAVLQALEECPPPPEILPEQLRQSCRLLPAAKACRAIHKPENMQELEDARRRLTFETFFIFSVSLQLMRARRAAQPAVPFPDRDLAAFYQALPFQLTAAQLRAIREITDDLASGSVMNRLVQGDVGSGKTAVAAAAAYCACRNGAQTAFMAPTEILAEQHFHSLQPLLEPLGVHCGLLTGSMTPAAKRKCRERLAAGQTNLIIGTHALLSGQTMFHNLGLVITDEQHRFGVEQRAALAEKAKTPHLLVMSATPIPRTLALILYGDLDVSVLDMLPPGRQPVDTFLVDEAMRPRINAFIRKHAAMGHQCFIVCPAIEENEDSSLKAAETWAGTLQQTVFPDLRVGLLHGRMSGAEKEAVMSDFAAGAFPILVSTTVIEVGVDIPNATLMIIEDADRFGLSQLHQLRGRVGRGRDKSYCVLLSHNRNPDTLQRLRAFCKTTDGFRIAEEDLRLRGPGDFFGSRQHGLPALPLQALSSGMEIPKLAQEAAAQWINRNGADSSPEAEALRQRIRRLFDGQEGRWN